MSKPSRKTTRTREPKAATNASPPKPTTDADADARSPIAKPEPASLCKDRKAARYYHRHGLLAGAYHMAIQQGLGKLVGAMGDDLRETAMIYVIDTVERMKPRDPMEEMLVAQAVMAHVRALHLSSLAPQQTQVGNVRVTNEYADRASNTFRRLMLALAEYRKPPRVGDSYTAIGQANIAGQQVVVNGGQENGNATNEQGSDQQGTGHDAIDHDAPTNATHTPPALSAEPRGPGIPPSIGKPDEALGAIHRAEDGRR